MPNTNPSHDGALRPQNMTREERIKNMGKMKEQHNGLKKLVKEDDTSILDNLEMFNHGLSIPKNYGRSLSYDSGDIISDEVGNFMRFIDEKRMSPTWVGLAIWLGIDGNTLSEWRDDPACPFGGLLKKISNLFHNFAQQKAMDGELNPLMYFFLAKNYWGLHDKTEIVHKSQSTQIIDISDQQRIINTTPGIIIDAEYSERYQNSILRDETEKDDKDYESLQTLLRGASKDDLEVLKSSRKVPEKFLKSSENNFDENKIYENDTKMTLNNEPIIEQFVDVSTSGIYEGEAWDEEL